MPSRGVLGVEPLGIIQGPVAWPYLVQEEWSSEQIGPIGLQDISLQNSTWLGCHNGDGMLIFYDSIFLLYRGLSKKIYLGEVLHTIILKMVV